MGKDRFLKSGGAQLNPKFMEIVEENDKKRNKRILEMEQEEEDLL